MGSANPAEQIRILGSRKEAIEAELDANVSILKANDSTLRSSLIDGEGFPRADIDIYAVRTARVRIIELRNDLDSIINDIGKALEGVYDPATGSLSSGPEASAPATNAEGPSKPFAKVDGVAPGSPAAEAGLKRDDLVLKFGSLGHQSFTSSSLTPLAELVAESENRTLPIKVQRGSDQVVLRLTPRKGWGGRGMLGCHIVPYSAP